jgi:hypothetical protein
MTSTLSAVCEKIVWQLSRYASALHQDDKHVSILIDRSPEIVLLATNRENYLIQMPFVPTARTAATQFIGVGLTKLQTPLSNRFIGHDNPRLGQKLFHIAKTERKAILS